MLTRPLFILACLPAINSRNERGTAPESSGLRSDLFGPARASYTRSRSESYDLARNNRRPDREADLKIIPIYAVRFAGTPPIHA